MKIIKEEEKKRRRWTTFKRRKKLSKRKKKKVEEEEEKEINLLLESEMEGTEEKEINNFDYKIIYDNSHKKELQTIQVEELYSKVKQQQKKFYFIVLIWKWNENILFYFCEQFIFLSFF